MHISYDSAIGDRWSCMGSDGTKEHHKTIRIFAFHRGFHLSWVWAIDYYGRRVTSPFRLRMNYTAVYWQLGYLRLHITEALRAFSTAKETQK